jgi:hypothetical protein
MGGFAEFLQARAAGPASLSTPLQDTIGGVAEYLRDFGRPAALAASSGTAALPAP